MMSGRDLTNLSVSTTDKPGSILVLYKEK
jgi:hypothetical protein